MATLSSPKWSMEWAANSTHGDAFLPQLCRDRLLTPGSGSGLAMTEKEI